MTAPYTPVQVLACILLSILFFWSGATEKLFGWHESIAYIRSHGLPMPQVLLLGALCIELVAPVLLFVYATSAAAALTLSVYCLATAILFHNFWNGDDALHSQLTNFLKNVALCGAFLYVFSDLQRRTQTRVRVRLRRVEGTWAETEFGDRSHR